MVIPIVVLISLALLFWYSKIIPSPSRFIGWALSGIIGSYSFAPFLLEELFQYISMSVFGFYVSISSYIWSSLYLLIGLILSVYIYDYFSFLKTLPVIRLANNATAYVSQKLIGSIPSALFFSAFALYLSYLSLNSPSKVDFTIANGSYIVFINSFMPLSIVSLLSAKGLNLKSRAALILSLVSAAYLSVTLNGRILPINMLLTLAYYFFHLRPKTYLQSSNSRKLFIQLIIVAALAISILFRAILGRQEYFSQALEFVNPLLPSMWLDDISEFRPVNYFLARLISTFVPFSSSFLFDPSTLVSLNQTFSQMIYDDSGVSGLSFSFLLEFSLLGPFISILSSVGLGTFILLAIDSSVMFVPISFLVPCLIESLRSGVVVISLSYFRQVIVFVLFSVFVYQLFRRRPSSSTF